LTHTLTHNDETLPKLILTAITQLWYKILQIKITEVLLNKSQLCFYLFDFSKFRFEGKNIVPMIL
jgi:hypothetical protein